MTTIIGQLIGVVVFAVGTLLLGVRLRAQRSVDTARKTSFISHLFFHGALLAPLVAGLFYPGIDKYDRALGWPALFPSVAWRMAGGILFVAGLGLIFVSQIALARLGKGAPSFILSQRVAASGIYHLVRNPLALGWYLAWLGLAWWTGSTYLTLFLLLAHIPTHIFYLKYFEELELSIRFGEAYRQYKKSVPFLIPWARSHS